MASGKVSTKCFIKDYITWDYTVAANAAVHTNLKTLIDADMPSGAKFFSINGWTTGSSHVHVQQCYYANADWSLHLRNSSSASQSATCYINYVYEI